MNKEHAPTRSIERPNLQQLEGRHRRLERELVSALGAQPLRGSLIERLVEQTVETAREIHALRA